LSDWKRKMPAEYVPTDAQRALVESASAFGSGCPKWDDGVEKVGDERGRSPCESFLTVTFRLVR
jgi:hypothetical protein